MHRICLINMPFFKLGEPSFPLTQLSGVLRARFPGGMSVEELYLNHDFAQFLGVGLTEQMAYSQEIFASGIGEWFFRKAAFPNEPDVTETFFNRYFPGKKFRDLKAFLMKKREGVDEFLERMLDLYKPHEADMVGFSSMFAQNLSSHAFAKKIKERNSSCILAVGGCNCDLPKGYRIVRNFDSWDFVFIGPSLVSFPRLVECISRGAIEECHLIKGVLSKSNCLPGGAFYSEKRKLSKGEDLDINEPIDLDYDPFFASIDGKLKGKYFSTALFFETSRGCWWGDRSRCSFCSLHRTDNTFIAKKPERALEDLTSVMRYSGRVRNFLASDIIMPKDYPKEVFSRLKNQGGVNITYEARVDLDEEDLRIMRVAGANTISVGIECLSTSSLKLINKGATVFKNIQFMKKCVLANMTTLWLFLVGIPGENDETYTKYLEDIPKVFHLPPPYYISPVIYERNNDYFNCPEEFDLKLVPYDFYNIIYPFDGETVRDMAHYFTNANLNTSYYKAMFRCFGKLKMMVDDWNAKWHGRGEAGQPMLFFNEDENGIRVYDSRYDEAVEHAVGAAGVRILKELEAPRTVAALHSALGDLSLDDIRIEVSSLMDKNLLFQEDGRYMSLVLPRRPPEIPSELISGYQANARIYSWEKTFDRSFFEEASVDG